MLATGRVSDLLLASGASGATALLEGDRVVTYGDLREAVRVRAGQLGLAERSLVVLGMTNTTEAVVTYLALLEAGHVPLLAGAHHAELAGAWEADAIVHTDRDGWSIEPRSRLGERVLHPELTLLLSTSGSTGAPKLVRLSHDNLASNAVAISTYLELTPADRAITSLPLHYCYGLSVLHSHLAAGAGVVMTTASVVDPCFAAALRAGGVTNIAGVPHTFDLLEQAGPERVQVPTLRFMTQAGGRMEPDRVTSWLDRTAGWGAELFVMYGQTEATARMAFLPPTLARRHPDAIGHAIPGGHLALRPVDGEADGVGEIVYRGPNVMLGYATTTADLAEGATLTELATGDLGRCDPTDGVFEVVGRRARFVKPFGLRIDLDAIERSLRECGFDAVATGDDQRLVVCVPGASPDKVRRAVCDLTALPVSAVIVDDAVVPRTAAGKIDHAALLARVPLRGCADAGGAGRGAAGKAALRTWSPRRSARLLSRSGGRPEGSAAAIFATVLGRSDVSAASTFVELGGDSLSYVECSVLLEERFGRLPADWHLRRADELDALGGRRGLPRLDTTALLRAVGVLLVVSTHMHLWYFPGGSHLMLAVVGYNACRFLFSIDGAAARAAATGRSMARLAVPTVAFVGACMLLVGGYGLPTLTLTNGYLGRTTHLDGEWHYWFIEVAVQLLVLSAVLLAIGPVRRAERRWPYGFALLLFAVSLVLREAWVGDNLRFQLHGVAWFFVLGWLVYQSTSVRTKLLTTAVCAVSIHGFFGMPHREWLIASGLVLLIWCREVPMPRFAIRPVAIVAASSMTIYVSHFRIWRVLDRNLGRGWAYVATIVAGIVIWFVAERALRAVRRRRLLVGLPARADQQRDRHDDEDRADHRPLDVAAHAVAA